MAVDPYDSKHTIDFDQVVDYYPNIHYTDGIEKELGLDKDYEFHRHLTRAMRSARKALEVVEKRYITVIGVRVFYEGKKYLIRVWRTPLPVRQTIESAIWSEPEEYEI